MTTLLVFPDDEPPKELKLLQDAGLLPPTVSAPKGRKPSGYEQYVAAYQRVLGERMVSKAEAHRTGKVSVVRFDVLQLEVLARLGAAAKGEN